MRRPRLSIKLRITLVTMAVVAVVLAGSSFLLVRMLQSSQLGDADQQLERQVDVVAGYLKVGLVPPEITPTGFETGQVQVVAPDRSVLTLTPGLAGSVRLDVFTPPRVDHQIARTVKAADLGTSGEDRFRVVARTVRFGFDWVTIYAASSLRSADQVVHHLVLGLWIVVPALVLLSGFATWLLTSRALRPVERMRREVDAIQSAGTEQRLSADQRATELDHLAGTLNGMLDRLSASEAIRRQFLADASHELRSPLASARAMLEVGLAYPDRTDWPETAQDVMVEVERLNALAVELMSLARAEGGERALARERIELGALVAEEAARYADDRIVTAAAMPVWVEADRPLLVRLLRNLLDNARRHAAGRISVSVGAGTGVASLQVHNDGDEIPVDQRERIFEPFTRLDEARARDAGGAGLGLSIARRIAEVHGGTLAAVDAVQGAAFLLTLPLAPDEAAAD